MLSGTVPGALNRAMFLLLLNHSDEAGSCRLVHSTDQRQCKLSPTGSMCLGSRHPPWLGVTPWPTDSPLPIAAPSSLAAPYRTSDRPLALSQVVPLYVFDPRCFGRSAYGPRKTGPRRAAFQLECVSDLRTSLKARGSDLLVAVGRAEDVIGGEDSSLTHLHLL